MFENYIIEKTKNERLIANLERCMVLTRCNQTINFIVGIKVDFNELYKNVPQSTSLPQSMQNSGSKAEPINIMVYEESQGSNLLVKEVKIKL